MKSFEDMMNTLWQRREVYMAQQQIKRKRRQKIAVMAACLCVVTALSAVVVWQGGGTRQPVGIPSGESSQLVVSSSAPVAPGEQESSRMASEKESKIKNSSVAQSVPKESSVSGSKTDDSKVPSCDNPHYYSSNSNSSSRVVAIRPPMEAFTDEVELKNWLLYGSAADQERVDMLQTMGNGNTMSYFRPNISSDSNLLTLKWITPEVGTATSITYHYRLNKNKVSYSEMDLLVTCYLGGTYVSFLTEAKEELKQGNERYYSAIYNNIEYIYRKNRNNKSISIFWEQFGIEHHAILSNKNDDLIDQILPLLNLQKVTFSADLVNR